MSEPRVIPEERPTEQFKDIPAPLTEGGRPLGYIENDPEYPDESGQIWLRGTWLDVAKARELRDWLNKVIP